MARVRRRDAGAGLGYWSLKDAIVNKALLVLVGFALSLILRSIYALVIPGPFPSCGPV